MTIQERIIFLLKQQNKTQKELCLAIGVYEATLSRWLKEGRSIPAQYIAPMANFFDVSLSYLLVGQEEIKSDFKGMDVHGIPIPLSNADQAMLKLKANAALTAHIQEIVMEEMKKHQG